MNGFTNGHRLARSLPVSLAGGLALFVSAQVAAQVAQTPVDGVDLFEKRIEPILEQRCFSCHGDPETAFSELVLTTRADLLRGGARGPAIDTSEPNESLLLRALSYDDPGLEMPPSGQLPESERRDLETWVRLGAPYGGDEDQLTAVERDDTFEITQQDRQWWSVLPLGRPDVPSVDDTSWPASDADRFLLARLEDAGLEPADQADRRTLIRRATYDLTGLPPTPEEVRDFLADARPDAWERLIDRLLASPHYGEKWGRHWLDLVRYAETDGYERDRLKPGAWRYRDWVINAFNADMPYDEFLVHQLAGDEIESPTLDSIIATGYIRLGIWDDEPTDTALAQYDDLDSVLDTTSRVMLGMSMGCARCHDHRGDPIPQKDYYRMLSFLRGIAPYKVGGGNAPNPEHYVELVPDDYGDPQAQEELATWRAERQRLAQRLEELADGEETQLPDEGLVAHLPLDEETALVALDQQGQFHGRVADATVDVDGVNAAAYRFDGEDDAIRIPRPVQGDFTISLWFRTDQRAHGSSVLEWYLGSGLVDANVSGAFNEFGLSLLGDGWIVAGTGSPPAFVHSEAGYNDGEWHHVAFTRHRTSGAIALFVDGTRVAMALGSTATLADAGLTEIGKLSVGDGYFAGDLDDVRFYDRVLETREIVDLATNGLTVASSAEGRQVAAALAEHLERRPRRNYLEILRVKELGPEPPPTSVLIRGNPHAPSDPVVPAFPQILTDLSPEIPAPGVPAPASDATSSGRRLALARWIASSENIRTSRVMANRLWQFHFGRGLVPTPNDFGKFGQPPTHPELLDWLAMELVERDWSLKAMHRVIMTSSAYKMSSRTQTAALESDPENLLFWRFPMRRLTAEELRDSILAANGTLNLEVGGPSVFPPLPEEVLATASQPDNAWGESTPEQAARRSVYIHAKRSLKHPLLETLDLADTDSTCPVRFVTTQPTQALTLLNSDFMGEQARKLAQRARLEATEDGVTSRVAKALELTLARQPEPREITAGVELLEDLATHEGFDPEKAFDSYCLVLLNLNEFAYLD